MRSASAALDALLLSGNPMVMADLYLFTLKSGSVHAYTDASQNIDLGGGNIFYANGPVLTRDKTRISLGLDTASMRITSSAPSNNSVMIGGYNWTTALRMGVFDGARVSVRRYIAPDFNGGYNSDYTMLMFDGEVRDVNITALTGELNIISNAYKFDTTVPLDNYAPSCVNQFGDSKCTFNRNSITVSSTATAATNNYEIPCNFIMGVLVQPNYLGGTVTFTSGNNNGVVRTIKSFEASGTTITKIYLTEPLPIPTTTEGFTLRQGCNKTYARCTALANQLNFRGYPFVPNPETIA